MPYGNRRHISQAVEEQIIAMSAHMKASQIAEVTGISGRTTTNARLLVEDWRCHCSKTKLQQASFSRAALSVPQTFT
ncbi:hypothetical protein PAXRUDRAFT_835650 [Paxillus rubicundulus Ve08.2h10]|uniref:HTH psq-type domain-containing protein n=1 Tax=Paxillus rubicundulus Ve08.2h10 TaxID=930991 RepID=A0A0D0BVV6_9AGAM|nr:hypothetical protein PAXRUDRAFT_835650 [Paxillus rubicundulus Ve08.2h10]